MGFSPLANMNRRIPHGNRQSKRRSKIKGFTIHHNAGVNLYGEATNPRREVSANYWITNTGEILPQIDETMRPYTTGNRKYPAGAASDHRNITVEVSNSPEGVRTKSWAISPAAEAALIRLIADVFKRHDLGPIRRGVSSGLGVHSDYVPTVCPGPWIKGRLPYIISQGNQILSGSTTIIPQEEGILDMDEAKLAKLINDQSRAAMISVLQDSARYTEYADEHGDGRNTRSIIDVLFSTHANAVGANRTIAAVAKESGVPVEKIVKELMTGITPLLRELLEERKVDFSVDEFLDGLAARLKE